MKRKKLKTVVFIIQEANFSLIILHATSDKIRKFGWKNDGTQHQHITNTLFLDDDGFKCVHFAKNMDEALFLCKTSIHSNIHGEVLHAVTAGIIDLSWLH